MKFLSLGAGVQSSTLLMLAIHGEIERPDHVIFADTGLEPRAVYAHLDWCANECAKASIPFHRVRAKLNIVEDFAAFEGGEKKWWDARPPLHVKMDGLSAIARRQCTDIAKIRPIQKKQLELLGVSSARRLAPGIAETMIGISTDEARRAVPARERWIDRIFPLIDPLKMSRADCQAWWDRNYRDVPLHASACIFCPFKSSVMWQNMAKDQPEDFEDACRWDERIRAAYLPTGQKFFLHRSLIPLRSAVLDGGQQDFDLEDSIYCAGGCGL